MSSDAAFPLRRNTWEKLSESSAYWGPAAAVLLGIILRDSLGLVGAAAVAVVVAVVVSLFIEATARKSRRRRLAANVERGVIEAVVRFTDESGNAPNSGWKEGALSLTDTGFSFQQLRGRVGRPVNAPIELPQPQSLGDRPHDFKQAPGLDRRFRTFGFFVNQREFEVAIDPSYLSDSLLRNRLGAKNSST